MIDATMFLAGRIDSIEGNQLARELDRINQHGLTPRSYQKNTRFSLTTTQVKRHRFPALERLQSQSFLVTSFFGFRFVARRAQPAIPE
jgi:hypothetical protein